MIRGTREVENTMFGMGTVKLSFSKGMSFVMPGQTSQLHSTLDLDPPTHCIQWSLAGAFSPAHSSWGRSSKGQISSWTGLTLGPSQNESLKTADFASKSLLIL